MIRRSIVNWIWFMLCDIITHFVCRGWIRCGALFRGHSLSLPSLYNNKMFVVGRWTMDVVSCLRSFYVWHEHCTQTINIRLSKRIIFQMKWKNMYFRLSSAESLDLANFFSVRKRIINNRKNCNFAWSNIFALNSIQETWFFLADPKNDC